MADQLSIYIVEDDDAVRDSMAMWLEAEGYVVHVFASCEAFLRAPRPDSRSCLVTDVNLPVMTGLQLLEQLEREGLSVPTIIMTGVPSRATASAAERIGAALIVKPFKPDDLFNCIQEKFAQREMC